MRPNIIFVFSDQHRLCDVGYAGNKQVKTPFLDMMSQESCEFTYAISGMPVCCPYRATLMTGMYPLSHGVFLNDLCMDTGGPYLGELFRDNGYSTAYIGKWHIDGHGRSANIPEERHRGFDFWRVLECTHDYNNSPYYSGNSPEKLYWEGYDAFAQTDCAVDYINSYDKEQPFFMILSYGPPNPWHKLYRAALMPLPNTPADCESLQTFVNRIQNRYKYRDAGIDKNFVRTMKAYYYACVSFVDYQIGKILDCLEENNMSDNPDEGLLIQDHYTPWSKKANDLSHYGY